MQLAASAPQCKTIRSQVVRPSQGANGGDANGGAGAGGTAAAGSRRGKAPAGGSAAVTELSCFDACIVATAIGRVLAFPYRLDPAALEEALQRTVDTLQFVGGRLGGMRRLTQPLASLHIVHTGQGVPFTVAEAEGVTLAAAGPDTWPAAGVTVAEPAWPWTLERLEVGKRWVAAGSSASSLIEQGCRQHQMPTALPPPPPGLTGSCRATSR